MHNWDALADCITDLSWLPSARVPNRDHEHSTCTAAAETAACCSEILAETRAGGRAEGVRALAVGDLNADTGDGSAHSRHLRPPRLSMNSAERRER